MKIDGATENARSALLDTLQALETHIDALVLVGAQAIYLQTVDFVSEVAPTTVDADFAIDTTVLENSPDIELVLLESNFKYSASGNPGQWMTPNGIPVDIMVPSKSSGRAGIGRSARLIGHSNKSVRRTDGLEACVVSFKLMKISSFSLDDKREFTIRVASPASIIVAKCFKIAERLETNRNIANKDSFDVYRLLAHIPMGELVQEFLKLLSDNSSNETTVKGIQYFAKLFTGNLSAPGIDAVGAAIENVGNVEIAKASVLALAQELINLLPADYL